MKINRTRHFLFAILLFVVASGGYSQIDSVFADTTRIDSALVIIPESLLNIPGSGDIVIPYRATKQREPYPANHLYQTWNQEFLTPNSFPKSAVPDTFVIKLVDFIFPTYEKKVTSDYGRRSATRQHYGVDVKIRMRDTIRAAFDGRVRMERYEPKGYGYYIVIRHPNGLETIYGHLSKYLVKVNQHVIAGEAIALGGNTGRSSGPHLHFETRFMGHPLNPNELIDFEHKSLLSDTYTYTKNKKISRTQKSTAPLRKT